MINLKRVYETPSPEDGFRVLVERLWPRGLTKEAAKVDHWAKEVSPSPELRKWYGHDPQKWPEFQSRYRKELALNQDELAKLIKLVEEKETTFVYAARDEERNSALILKGVLENLLAE